MKRIFITLAMSLVVLGLCAQEHLSFKGIPIEGSMSSFSQKLKAKGFTLLDSDNNIVMFTGDFTGREVTVGVQATSDGRNVFGVVVLFPESDEWNILVNTYGYYKDLYTRKYGEPSVCKEKNPARSDTNVALMAEVNQGTVVYGSAWEVSGGTIELSIEKGSRPYEGVVAIKYRDSKNMEEKINKDLDDI